MKSLKGIASFVAVASSGSFAAAAKLQGVSAVAVSKNVSTLERQLNVRLFVRSTRQLALTPEGQQFYAQCQGPLQALEAAQASASASAQQLTGLIRVTSVAPFGMGVLAPLLPAFHALHPGIQVELHLDDAVNDMVGDGYDVGFRVGELQDSSLVARPIAGMPFAACASAGYLAARGTPRTLDDLSAHNCLRLRRKGSQNPMPWFLKGMEPALDKRCVGHFLANDFAVLVQAARQGQGIACVPLPQLLPFLRSGALQLVLSECVQARFQVYMHYPSRKNIPMRLRVFIDFVLAALEKNSDLNADPAQLLADLN